MRKGWCTCTWTVPTTSPAPAFTSQTWGSRQPTTPGSRRTSARHQSTAPASPSGIRCSSTCAVSVISGPDDARRGAAGLCQNEGYVCLVGHPSDHEDEDGDG